MGQEKDYKEYNITTENEIAFCRQASACGLCIGIELLRGLALEAVAILKRSPATFRSAYEGTLDEGELRAALDLAVLAFP